ncbi:unnamed protein product, partial [Didymodactylos carnosus]
MLQSNSGTVTVEGYDNTRNLQTVRKMIGYCPQYDILYDELSVNEHLELVAKLRSMTKDDMNNSINKILTQISLSNDEKKLAKDLSGGMKRRLSVGMALIGDPEVTNRLYYQNNREKICLHIGINI